MKKISKLKKPKDKIGNKPLDSKQIAFAKRLIPLEDIIHLAGICDISLRGRDKIGALILKKGDDIQIRYCFDCVGIHPSMASEQITSIFDSVEGGLKEIPDREFVTVHFGSFTNDFERQSELKRVQNNCDIEQIKLLVGSERLRAKELTQKGIRKNKFLRLWCTFTVTSDDESSSDFAELTIKKLLKAWHGFTGEIHQINNTRIENILINSFVEGFSYWEQIISNKMGLSTKPLSAEEIWGVIWRQFNGTEQTSIPNLLKLNDEELLEHQTSDFHIRHHVLEKENSIPFFDRQWVKIQDKYIGALTFSEKPGGWLNEYSQLRYLWDAMSREKVSDTEVFCQISKVSQAITRSTLQLLTKQSIMSSKLSTERNSIDVGANLNIEESVEAQKTMYKGSAVVNTAVAFLVHRSTTQELADATRYISNCFLRPAVVSRETEIAWKVWLQCCPLVWERLLSNPFERRLTYFSSEAPGIMPLIRTATGDRRGFELIAEEGGTPVHLDLYNQHKNLAVFGTSRSGKSVLVAGIVTNAIALDIPVVALDYPKPDGTSTFTDYTNLLGSDGAYFDISKESNNLFELPNLRGMSEDLQKERLLDFQEFLKSVLMTMICGTSTGELNPSMVSNIESIISLALQTFFKDDQIRLRYQASIKCGFGTPEWDDTPTLKDFCKFCTAGYINLDSLASNSKEVKEALGQIEIRLKSWLASRIGQSISKPSTFRADAKLLVFALRNLSSESDAAILALSAYAAALRRALSSKASIFFLDEAPILFQFESIADLIGRLCANGAKSGIRVILSAQEPETIFQSKAASKIFANITTRLVGRIQTSAVAPFIQRFQYSPEIISKNSKESFYPAKEGIYSQWLLDDNGKLTFCRYYPAYCLLAAVANNPDEQELRTLFLNKYKYDPILGLFRFSEDYVKMIRGEELSLEAKALLETINNLEKVA
jgi:hypothetical protein